MVQSGEIKRIVHTSTGKANTPTQEATFYVYWKIAFWLLNQMPLGSQVRVYRS